MGGEEGEKLTPVCRVYVEFVPVHKNLQSGSYLLQSIPKGCMYNEAIL